MNIAIKSVRTLCAVIAAWQLVGIFPALTWFDEPPPFLGAATATLVLKLLVMVFFFVSYQLLGRLQRNHLNRPDALRTIRDRRWQIGLLEMTRKQTISATLILLTGIAALIWAGESHLRRTTIDDACTPNILGLQRTYPNLHGYTAVEVAERLAAPADASALLAYLTECRWTRVNESDTASLYVDEKTVALHPGNRRSAYVMLNFILPQYVNDGDVSREYRSSVLWVVVDCARGGMSILARERMLHAFNSGAQVSREDRDSDAATVPLRLHPKESHEYIVSRAICNFSP